MTKERKSLLEVICDYDGHFSPEDIARSAQSAGKSVSLTTIYRNLPLLIEAGIIECVSTAKPEREGVRYERVWNQDHHDHLTCSLCGRQVEFSYPAIEVLQEAVANEHGFTLERHYLELIGTCPDCATVDAPVCGREKHEEDENADRRSDQGG